MYLTVLIQWWMQDFLKGGSVITARDARTKTLEAMLTFIIVLDRKIRNHRIAANYHMVLIFIHLICARCMRK